MKYKIPAGAMMYIRLWNETEFEVPDDAGPNEIEQAAVAIIIDEGKRVCQFRVTKAEAGSDA